MSPDKNSPRQSGLSPDKVLSPKLRKRTSIWNPLIDFWALGGLSILLCMVLHTANYFRNDLPLINMRFMQIMAVFSVLSIVCNHPHFMISYRFGYGRGIRFIIKNWISLLLVPLALIGCYTLAYLKFDTDISDSIFIVKTNELLSLTGLSFHIGESSQLGREIMGLSIWLMYFTVGWHYCKQIYGCMMVYAFYDGYKLSTWQKHILKWSVISVALYQFVYSNRAMEEYAINGSIQDQRFQGVYMSTIGLPEWVLNASIILMAALMMASVLIMATKYRTSKQLPSINFIIPWIAFYVWWVPLSQLPEYYLLMVPFFHSLQYLPFAFRLESEVIKKDRWYNANLSIRILILLAIGFLSFELVPAILDKNLGKDINQMPWFFITAFSVFINIHHFFIDSVVWKFKNSEVQSRLLYESS